MTDKAHTSDQSLGPGVLIVAASAAFLVSSVAFNFGTFLVVGSEYLPLLTIEDHIGTGILVFPPVLLMIMIAVPYFERMDRLAKTYHSSQADEKVSKQYRRNVLFLRVFLIVGIFVFVLEIIFGNRLGGILLLLAVLWLVLAARFEPRIEKLWASKRLASYFVLLPFVAISIIATGAMTAGTLANDEDRIHNIILQNEEVVTAPIVRATSVGVFVYKKDRFELILRERIWAIQSPKTPVRPGVLGRAIKEIMKVFGSSGLKDPVLSEREKDGLPETTEKDTEK